jgi:hypothetical protein
VGAGLVYGADVGVLSEVLLNLEQVGANGEELVVGSGDLYGVL